MAQEKKGLKQPIYFKFRTLKTYHKAVTIRPYTLLNKGLKMTRQPTENAYIIRLRKTAEKTGLSRSTLYNLIKAGTFVPKIQISTRAIGFLESDVDKWIAGRVAASKMGAGQ
jgi:prophage regulatory protein